MAEMIYRVVDLFSGCGGLSRGFEWTGRFGIELGVELQAHPAKAFALNIKNARGENAAVYQGDVDVLANDAQLFEATLNRSGISSGAGIDVIAGGPPCQGFSRNGPRLYFNHDKTSRFYDHPNNHLYRSFLSFVERLRPKLVLIENVREFLKFGGGRFSYDLKQRFAELGYEIEAQKVNAADFGVPQSRHRVFFIAVRKDVADTTGVGPQFPTAPFKKSDSHYELGLSPPHRTVREAIVDLPEPIEAKDGFVRYETNMALSDLAKRLRSTSGGVYNHINRKLSKIQIERINAVGIGRMKYIEDELKTKKFYGSAYRRLAWDEPALTITTWVYHVGSGRFAHPVEDRGLTMREAARLQSFDDDFVFPSFINPTSQMIGNAVPPLVSYAFAQQFSKILDKFYEKRLGTAERRHAKDAA